jgi:hypothetical protein
VVQQTIYDALVAGWLAGASHAMESTTGAATPEAPIPQMLPPAIPPPATPVGLEAFYPDDEEPLIRLPAIEHGIKQLQERQILESSEFYALAGAAKERAFTITADIAADSIAKVRDTIVEDLQEGTSLGSFRAKLAERLETLPISEAHLEQVYRNNVNEAFSQGMEKVLEHPQVDAAFPYRQYVAIHDARARHDHLEMEKLGLDQTAIYHSSDPTWRRFRPPFSWNCRCGWIGLSIKDAARKGVREAQEWLSNIDLAKKAGTYDGLPSSVEPDHIWVKPPPFNPPPGWERLGE